MIDHIIPRSMGGNSDRANLAASCYRCNEFKGARTDAIDPVTEAPVSLFHPRQQIWTEHFAGTEEGRLITGLTPAGRATVNALKLNNEYVVESRRIWVAQNWHPPNF